MQSFLGRYTIASGETGLEAFNRIPGKIGKVNWVVWAWAAMVFITLFQISAMFIGVSQAMKLVTGIDVVWWVLAFFVLTLVLLLGGAYHRIERLAMVKVGLFTLITLLSAVVLTRMPQYFSWADVAQGFTFQLPATGLAIAVAVFGITGVGATELYMYTYWCVEKGYARYTGAARGQRGLAPPRARLGARDERRRDLLDDHLHRRHDRLLPARRRHPARHGAGAGDQRHDPDPVQHLHRRRSAAGPSGCSTSARSSSSTARSSPPPPGHSRMFADFMRLQGVFEHDDIQGAHALARHLHRGADGDSR